MSFNLPPMRGPFDMSKVPAVIVTNIQGTLFVLTMIMYDVIPEFVFTPFNDGQLSATIDNKDYKVSLLQSFQVINNPTRNSIFVPEEVEDSSNNKRSKIKYVEPVAVTWDGSSFSFDSLNDGTVGMRILTGKDSVTGNVATGVFAFPKGASTDFTIKPLALDNNYFDQDPTFFAGFPYSLDYDNSDDLGFPFRIFRPYSKPIPDGSWLQPSTCNKIAFRDPPFLCNLDSHGTNPNNVSYFLEGIANEKSEGVWYSVITIEKTVTPLPDTPIFFLPIEYFQANFENSGNSIGPSSEPCVGSLGVESLLNNFYYFWSSGFSQYSNDKDLTKFNPMITNPAPGFIATGSSEAVNISSWTNLKDCQRSYFYNYCSSISKCGPCLGQCLISSLNCDDNINFTPTNMKNVNPFTCFGKANPKGFWDRWRDWIIGGIVAIISIILFVIIVVAVSANKKSKESTS